MPLILSGSVDISGSMTATTIVVSAPGSAGMVSSSAQITELAPLMAYTASLKSAAIVSSSQQVQNYFTFARTGSTNTFYGTQTINGDLAANVGGFSNYISVGGTSGLNTYGTINVPTGERMILNSYHGLELKTSGGIGSGTPMSILKVDAGGKAEITGSINVNGTFRTTTPNRSFFITSNAYSISDGTLSSGFGMDGDGLYLGNVASSTGWTISNPQVTIRSTGKVGIGASTNPTYILEASTASGSERIRVGTLQNNSNTATFEAITSAGLSSATSGWIRALYGGGLAVGTSTYTKAGGDSGNFANLSAESATTAITVNGGNTYLGQTTFFRTDVIGAQNYGGSTIRIAGGAGTSAAGIQFGDVSNNTTGARGRIGFLASANNGNPKEFAIIKGVLDSTGANTCNGSLTFHTLNGDNATEAAVRMTIDGSGNIGAASGTNIYNASDARLKQNISSISGSLNSVLALNPVKFNWVDDFVPSENGKDMLGFVAQEIQTIIPEAVESFGADSIFVGETEIDNPLRVNEKFLIPVLTKAIQEQQAIIDGLIARIEALENN